MGCIENLIKSLTGLEENHTRQNAITAARHTNEYKTDIFGVSNVI